MTAIEQAANNLKIAHYMGAIKGDELHTPDDMVITAFHDSEIQYDTSWDWLMPVVEKIGGITDVDGHPLVEMSITYNSCSFAYGEAELPEGATFGEGAVYNEHGATLLEMVYLAVVEFVQWYNEHTTDIEEQFQKWMADGNVVKTGEDTYLEQCTQWKREFTLQELHAYFMKEFINI